MIGAALVHFFRLVVGVAAVNKEVLSARTADYQNWVEAYARNHGLPIEWAEKGGPPRLNNTTAALLLICAKARRDARDEVLGPMAIRVASFFPFQTTYYLNGHSFIE